MYNSYMKDNTVKDEGTAVSKARGDLADMLNRVAYAHERVVLARRGKNVAALVPIEDLRLLELLEDKADLTAARKALAEAKGKKLVAWKDLKKKLGL